MRITCCKDCPDRRVIDGFNCHDHCKTYKAQKAIKNAENAEHRAQGLTTGYFVDVTGRIKKANENMKHKLGGLHKR